MEFNNRTFIIFGIASTLAIFIGGAVAFLLLSGRNDTDEVSEVAPTEETVEVQAGQFNINVFNRSAFRLLDQRLINEGALPVAPPHEVGKANPFSR